MKHVTLFIVCIGILSMFIAGCSSPIKIDRQMIEVQKRIGDENNYEDFKEITKSKHVRTVREIVTNRKWESEKAHTTPADYRFSFQFKDANAETKSVLYEIWITPRHDQIDLASDIENKYVRLDNDTSAELFEILTGEKLSE